MSAHKYTINYLLFAPGFFVYIYIFGDRPQLNEPNLFLGLVSIILSAIYLNSIMLSGIKAYNVTGFFYYMPLFVSTFALSQRQLVKEWQDMYYLLPATLILTIILYVAESVHLTNSYRKARSIININYLFWVLLVAFIILKIYIGSQVGFKLFSLSDEDADLSFDAFAIPGWSGAAGILQWLILLFLFVVTPKNRIAGVLALIVFNSVLGANRGDLLRVFLFIVFFKLYSFDHARRVIKDALVGNSRKSALVFLIAAILFVVLGAVREELQARDIATVVDLSQLVIESEMIAWLYTYFALGFDNLLLYVKHGFTNDWSYLLAFLNPSERIRPPVDLTLWPFNHVTYIRGYLAAFGDGYILLVCIKAVILGSVLMWARLIGCKPVIVFVITLSSLSFFSDYFLSRSVLVSIFLFLMLWPYLRRNNISIYPPLH